MPKEKKYNYTYITTNLITGKKYVGDRSCDCNPREDKYLGSGVLLIKDLSRYSKKNFKKEILEFFDTKQEAYNAQAKYIKLYETHEIQGGYNKNWTGGQWATVVTKETAEKISLSNKGRKSNRKGKLLTQEHRNNIKKSAIRGSKHPNHIGNITEKRRQELLDILSLYWNNEGSNNPMFGKTHTKESKEKNREAHLKENISIKTLEQMSISAKNKPRVICKYCGKNITTSMHSRWHGDNCKNRN